MTAVSSLAVSSMLLVAVFLSNLPIFAAVMLLRRRFTCVICAVILTISFAAMGACLMWTAERFDVYRHGLPPARYFARTMVAPSALAAVAGWVLGHAIGRGGSCRVPS